MSLVKQLASQTVIYGLGNILPRIVHFLVFSSYLTYKLNESRIEYAIYADLYAYASLLLVVFSYRMDTAMFRYGSKEENLDLTYTTALIPMIATSLLVLIIGYMTSEPLAALLTYPGQGHYVRWFSWILALDVIALLPFARLRLQDKARLFVSFKIFNVVLTVLLVLFFLEWGGNTMVHLSTTVDYVFFSNLIASAVLTLGLLAYNFPSHWKVDMKLWRRMVRYSLPLIIVGIAGSINQFFGVPLQKFFLGSAIDVNKDQAAVYAAVQKIPALLAMFATAYNYAAEPFFFKNADRSDSKKLYGDIALFFIIVAGLLCLVIYFYLDIIQYVIGSNYREGLYLVPVLLLAYLFLGLYFNVSIWYKLSDKTHYGAIIASIGALITLVGSYLLLPRIGIFASAWVALLCYFVMVVLAYLWGQKYYPIDYPRWPMIRALLVIVGIMVLGSLLRSGSLIVDLGVGTLLILSYCALMYLWEKKRLKMYL